MSAIGWAALAAGVAISNAVAHTVGFLRGQRDMRARTQGIVDTLVLRDAHRDAAVLKLKREFDELVRRHEETDAQAVEAVNHLLAATRSEGNA